MQILDTYNLYLNYCVAYASIIFIQSKMTRGIKLQFISIMVERTKAKSTQNIYFLRILTHVTITYTFGYAQIQRINNELKYYIYRVVFKVDQNDHHKCIVTWLHYYARLKYY